MAIKVNGKVVSFSISGKSGQAGAVYEAGDGIAITSTQTGEQINVKVPVQPLTKAEYDALPDADRQKEALYVVTDEEDGGGTGGGGEGGIAGVASFNGRTGTVVPTAGDYTAEMVGARPDTWTPSAAEVKARPDTWTPTASDVGAVPTGVVSAFQVLTEAEYAALAAKSATTLYLIKE